MRGLPRSRASLPTGRSDRVTRVTLVSLRSLPIDLLPEIEKPHAKVIVVGHDWGGIAGWELARTDPELLARLVVINAPHPALFYRELKHDPAQLLSSSYAGFFQVRGLSEATLRAFDFAALRAMGGGMRPPASLGPASGRGPAARPGPWSSGAAAPPRRNPWG